jgi:hypothetical protein
MNIVQFSDGKKGVLDIEFIKNQYKTGVLKDAHIMAELFGIREDSQFKQEGSGGKISYNFIEWDVTFEDWLLLIKFIKFGNLESASTTFRTTQLEKLFQLGHKLGGIPTLDLYYKQFHNGILNNNLSKIPDDYNPQSPEQDRFKLYQWVCIEGTNSNISRMVNYQNWSCTEVNFTRNISHFFYYRRLHNQEPIKEALPEEE